MEHVLVIDVGTSSLKSMLYSRTGTLEFRASMEYQSEFGHNNYVEQDTLTWKSALANTLVQVGQYAAQKDLDVVAVAVTSQRASVIPVDDEGRPLHKALMWQDKRSIAQCRTLTGRLGMEQMYRRTGLRVDPYFSLPKMMWLKDERPDLYRAARKLLGVQDYVVHLLTGEYVTDCSQACRTMLMNINTFAWDDDMLAASGVDKAKLPELIAPGGRAGRLTRTLAEVSGLPAGIPVIVCGGDQQCAALSLGVLRPGDAEANTGTGSFVIAYSEAPHFHPECKTLCSASALAGKWIVEAGIFTTGLVHRWFKDEFYAEAADGYALMNAEAQESPPGANGVILLPHFEGCAAPYWNPLAKGLFFNLSMATKRSDLARAVLEGISLEIAHNLSLLEELTGDISLVSVAGGLTSLDLFNQIQADCFAKPVIRHDNNEASSLGALMSAGVTLGFYDSHQAAFQAILESKPKLYTPDENAVARYARSRMRKDKLYQALLAAGVYDEFQSVLA